MSLHRIARAVWRLDGFLPDKSWYLVSAGWNPSGLRQVKRMATLMREHLVEHWSVPESDVIDCGSPDTWRSIGELRAAKRWISAHSLECASVHICSSWWHVPRLWLQWKLESPYRNSSLRLVCSNDRLGLGAVKVLAHEIVATMLYLIKDYPQYLFSRT